MEIFILKIFNLNFNNSNFNNSNFNNKYFKNKTSYLSYILLSYIYYKKFNKILNFQHILKNENGKPYLKNNEFFFNISHSKNYICIGINNYPIGVDIEEERKINKNALSKFLTENELNNNEISNLKYWVIKEAYSKYLGVGLKLNFKTIDLNLIKKDLFVNEIKSDNFICYAISKSNLKKVNFVNENLIIDYFNMFF